MTKLYIQKESQEPVTEIMLEGSDGDSFSISTPDMSSFIRISCGRQYLHLELDDIDDMIGALQKAKEIWG